MRSDTKLIIICIVVLFVGVQTFTEASGPDVFFDLRDSLGSWARSVDDTGSLEDLPDALIEGDLFSKSYAVAESQISAPALRTLDMTHSYINEFCGGKLDAKYTTTVFSRSTFGEDLKVMLGSKNILDDVQSYDFSESCVEVYKCYYEEYLLEQGVDLAQYNAYTDTTYQGCMNVVTRTYSMMSLYANSHYTHRDTNYGDDMIANGNDEEWPFDLLSTIENIGNILFYNNQQASKISFYGSNSGAFLKPTDPKEIIPEPMQEPDELSREDRFPRTIGVTPQIPDGTTGAYVPPTEPVAGRTAGGHIGGVNTENRGSGAIQNQICEAPVLDETPQEDLFEAARQEREYVYNRNEQFDIDSAVAVALGSMVAPEIEEMLGDDSNYIDQTQSEYVQEVATGIYEEMGDVSANGIEAFKNHVRGCVEAFTAEHPDAWEKILYKSITQPALFTECVYRGICTEIGDPSKLGMYRIKVCRVPSHGAYNVNANQPVQSVEEIIDELSNVCFGLRESGQLLKHNKTKDHWTNKLMEIDLGNIFSFGISISFKGPPTGQKDRAAIQRLVIERHKYLQSFFLGFSDDLTTDQAKNKYNIIHNPIVSNILREEETVQDALLKANAFRGASEMDKSRQEYLQVNQAEHYSSLDLILQEFVRQNTDFWIFTAEHTKSMKESREATHEKFKNSQ